MAEISRINMDAARFDPEKEFGTPDKLAEAIGMTRGQKIAALDRWSKQVLDRLGATSEGMPTHRTSGRDMQLIDEIQAVLAGLKAAGDKP